MFLLVLKWIAFIIPSLVMAVVGRILAPILPFFADENARLPKWLDWFNTPHSSLDGDRKHQEKWKGDDAFHTWLRRTAWLLRNVAYGFDRQVLGVTYKPSFERTIKGNPEVGDLTGVSGHCYWEVKDTETDKYEAFQHYWVYHYKFFNTYKCVRIGIGWKVWGSFPDERDNPCYFQFWLYFHPWKHSGLDDKE